MGIICWRYAAGVTEPEDTGSEFFETRHLAASFETHPAHRELYRHSRHLMVTKAELAVRPLFTSPNPAYLRSIESLVSAPSTLEQRPLPVSVMTELETKPPRTKARKGNQILINSHIKSRGFDKHSVYANENFTIS